MRHTRGIEAVIFDWAGTAVDHGSLAPIAPFLEVFRRRGVALTPAAARGPMGMHKRLHLEALCALPEVDRQWRDRFGRPPSVDAVDAMFAELVQLQRSVLLDHATPIPGCLETVAWLRARAVRIGSTTGYVRAMMDVLAPAAARLGFSPDVIVCADEVKHARPHPDMCLRNAIELSVSSVDACVKVDDTPVGVEEGLNAGMWTIGVVMTGNELGCGEEALRAMDPDERARRREEGYAHLRAAGAHFVVDGIADVPRAVEEIVKRRARRAA